MFKNFHKIKNNAGMTLIELLVVLSIFIILTSITIFDYGSFRSSISIKNLADDIALSIRKAQSYATGVYSDSNFISGYGVHFTTNTDTTNKLAGSNKSFVIFNDLPQIDHTYNYFESTCGIGAECNEILNIITADQISAIYVSDNSTDELVPNIGSLDISFNRPNPDAYFCYKASANPGKDCDRDNSTISHVEIVLSNDQTNKTQAITIWNTGQISVQ